MARTKTLAEGRSLQTRADALVAAGLITKMHAYRLVARREERVIADWEKRLPDVSPLTPALSPEGEREQEQPTQLALLEV